jgi:hypothetical protein
MYVQEDSAMTSPLQGSALVDYLRGQVREAVDRTLADPDYARKMQALVLADAASEELSTPPPAMLADLAEIEVLTLIRPFVQQPAPRSSPLAQLPDALREFAGRLREDEDLAHSTRAVVDRVNARNRSDMDDLYDLVGLFARSPEELSQLMPIDAEELLPGTTVLTTITTTTTATTTMTLTTPATTTTTVTTFTTTTTLSNFCPHVEGRDK